MQALLLLGWLASRLEWRSDGPATGDALAIYHQGRDRDIIVTVAQVASVGRDESWLREGSFRELIRTPTEDLFR